MSSGDYLPPLVTELKADLSDLKKGIAEAKQLVKGFKEDVEGLGTEFRKTGDESTESGKKVSEFSRLVGTKMRDSKNAIQTVREEYQRLGQVQDELRRKLRTGDGDGESLFKELGDVGRDLNSLRKIGTDLGMNFISGMSSTISAGGPYLQAALWAAVGTLIVVTSPLIGAAIASGLLLGLGGGVIGLGAFLLKDNKAIKAGFEELGKTAKGVFQRAAEPLKEPLLNAMKGVGTGLKKMEPEFKKLFSAAAPLVDPLKEAGLGFVSSMLPGLKDALTNAKPLFDSLKTSLPIIGAGFGSFFKQISENGPALALFFKHASVMIAGFLVVTGWLIARLTDLYGWAMKSGGAVREWLGKAWEKINEWATKTGEWAKTALKQAGAWLLFGFYDGIRSGWNSIKDKVAGIFGNVTKSAKTEFDSHSPSRVFEKIGQDTVAGYVLGVQGAASQAQGAWAGLLRPTVASPVQTFMPSLAMPGRGGTAGGGGQIVVETTINIDGRAVITALTPAAQQRKTRSGFTGLA